MALTKTEVSQLYVSIFGRASEGEGNTYWQTEGASLKDAATKMLATDAAATYFGDSLDTNQAFIEHIYVNTLGKTYAEDTDGVDYWVKLLEDGATRGEVVAKLVVAAQAPENAGAAQDQFNNKVAVSDYVADTIATADVNDLSAFTNYIKDVDDTTVSVDTAKDAAKADADAAATTSGLVTALETLDAANTAKSDALKAQLTEYLADEDIVAAYGKVAPGTNVLDGEETTLSADEDVYDGANGTYQQDGAVDTVEEIVFEQYEDASTTLQSLVTVNDLSTQTATIQDAAIEAANVTLNAAITSAEITAADGMTSLLTKADTKAEAYKAALDAKYETGEDLTDEIALFATANSNATMAATPVVKLEDYGTGIAGAEIVVMTKAEYEASTTDFSGEFLLVDGVVYNGVNASTVEFADLTKSERSDELSSAYSADVSAQTAVDSAYTSLASAVKAVYITEKDAYAVATADSSLSAISVDNSTPSDNVVTLNFDQAVDVYATKADKESAVKAVYTIDLTGVSLAATNTVSIDGNVVHTAAGAEAASDVATGIDGSTVDINGVIYDIDATNLDAVILTAQTAVDNPIADIATLVSVSAGTPPNSVVGTQTVAGEAGTTNVTAAKADDLYEAIADLAEFNEAVAAFTAAREDKDTVDALNETIADAEAAIENATDATVPGLGLSLTTIVDDSGDAIADAAGTPSNDVFLLNLTDDILVDITNFGSTGMDRLFIGDEYSIVELGSDDSISDSLGSLTETELFIKDTGADIVLYLEQESFAGNSAGTADMITITLSGVPSVDDLTIDGGFISAGTIA